MALFFVSSMVAALPAQAQDTSITVNTTADEDNSDGDCSLREAIIAANTNSPRDACAAGSATEEDAIGFDLGSSPTTITISGTADVNTVVELFEGSDSRGTDRTDLSGKWSIDLSAVSEGPHSYKAKATDRAGNVSSGSAARTVVVDTTAPKVEGWTPKGKKVSPTAKPTVTFSEVMDEGSVEATDANGMPTTIVLKKGSVQVAATVALDETGRRPS